MCLVTTVMERGTSENGVPEGFHPAARREKTYATSGIFQVVHFQSIFWGEMQVSDLHNIFKSFIVQSSHCPHTSLQCRRFLWARNLLAKAPCWNLPKRGGNGASQRERGGGEKREEKTPALFLLSPIFHCHKITDGGYNNIMYTNKVSPTQNTPALQAILAQSSCWNRY